VSTNSLGWNVRRSAKVRTEPEPELPVGSSVFPNCIWGVRELNPPVARNRLELTGISWFRLEQAIGRVTEALACLPAKPLQAQDVALAPVRTPRIVSLAAQQALDWRAAPWLVGWPCHLEERPTGVWLRRHGLMGCGGRVGGKRVRESLPPLPLPPSPVATPPEFANQVRELDEPELFSNRWPILAERSNPVHMCVCVMGCMPRAQLKSGPEPPARGPAVGGAQPYVVGGSITASVVFSSHMAGLNRQDLRDNSGHCYRGLFFPSFFAP